MNGKVNAMLYEWKGNNPQAKMMVVDAGDDFAGIIDSGTDLLYVANVGCHPIVATKSMLFLNSDGSTDGSFP